MSRSRRTRNRIVAAVAIIFALLTLHLSLVFTGAVGWSHHLEWQGDFDYMLIARNAMAGRGYSEIRIPMDNPSPTAYRSPIYPFFLIGAFTAFDGSEPTTRLLQSVLTALLVFLAVMLAARLGGIVAACVAGAVLIPNADLYAFAATLTTETLFAFLCIVFTWFFVQGRYRLAGLTFALLTLAHGTLVLALPLLALYIWQQRRLLRFALPFLAIMGVWTARNAIVMHSFIPISTGSGLVLYGANNPVVFAQARGYWIDAREAPGTNAAWVGGSEIQQDESMRADAIAYLRSVPPLLIAANVMAKISAFFGIFEDGSSRWTLFAAIGSSLSFLSLRVLRTRRSFGVVSVFAFLSKRSLLSPLASLSHE